jgi:hypothetical protein
MVIRQIISFVTLISFFLVSFPAHASPPEHVSMGAAQFDPKISPMKKGDKAPFDGTLFNPDAAAKILVDIEHADEQCMIETEKAVEKEKAQFQLKLDNLQASHDALKQSSEERIALKNDHIKFLEAESTKMAKKEKRIVWWLLGGIAGGIALSIAGAFIVREVRQQPSVVVVDGT